MITRPTRAVNPEYVGQKSRRAAATAAEKAIANMPITTVPKLAVTLVSQHAASVMAKWAETKNLSGSALTIRGVTFCAANVGTLVCDLRVNGTSVLTGTVAVGTALTASVGTLAAARTIPMDATIELWASAAVAIYALTVTIWCEVN